MPISIDSERNKQAWDALYRQTDGSVWGADPIPFVEEFVSVLRPSFSGETCLLDAATGEGRHLPVLLKGPGKIVACDASSNGLAKISQVDPRVERVQCDLVSTPFPDESIDLVTLIDTIETLPNPETALKELWRVLKPGGKLLCNIPGKDDEISGEEMGAMDGNDEGAFLYQSKYFYRFYEEAEALELIRRCGFEVLRSEIRRWREAPHPGFREYPHQHTSRVFLLIKSAP